MSDFASPSRRRIFLILSVSESGAGAWMVSAGGQGGMGASKVSADGDSGARARLFSTGVEGVGGIAIG